MSRKLLNSELKRLNADEFKASEKLPVIVVLDNVRSMHNIGSAFRTCDAFRVEKIILCGISATPPSAEIHKTALGAEDSVTWEYFKDTAEAVIMLKSNNYNVIALEQAENSIMLNEFKPQAKGKYALVFGNEVKGVNQNVVDICDACLEIPQIGTKHSLNVSVSIGITIWDFACKMQIFSNF